jgi:hypothetical protein
MLYLLLGIVVWMCLPMCRHAVRIAVIVATMMLLWVCVVVGYILMWVAFLEMH